MRLDDRFDDLVTSLGGFYRTWYVYAGLELGLFVRLREAGPGGLTAHDAVQGARLVLGRGPPGAGGGRSPVGRLRDGRPADLTNGDPGARGGMPGFVPAGVGYRAPVTRFVDIDPATMLALERHETAAHAIPSREVRDLGDALLLHDPRDHDPFWNRLAGVRWPDDPVGFDRRLTEAMALFAVLGRRPHAWPSPVHGSPADLVARLEANGFRDVGGGHVMILVDTAACPPLRPEEPGSGVSIAAIAGPRDAAPRDLDDAGSVLAAAFGAAPGRAGELAADLRRTLGDPRVLLVLARVHGVAAAVAKATTFDGFTYLSSIGTLPGYRGRGLGALVTRHAVAAAGVREAGTAYLGVFSGNGPAVRLYERLGFASVGESPDMILEWPAT